SFFHGRPMICSNIGGMAEKITDGVDGLHFRVGSSEDLVDRITEALSDPTLWDRLRAGIKQPISYEECARHHLELYQAIAERKARSVVRSPSVEPSPSSAKIVPARKIAKSENASAVTAAKLTALPL